MKRIVKTKIFYIILISLTFSLLFIYYETIYLDKVSELNLEVDLKDVTMNVFEEYKEVKYHATFRSKDITKYVKIKGKVDTDKVGEYSVIYSLNYKNKKVEKKRKIIVVDSVAPEIKINGDAEISFYAGDKFNDPLAIAIDNYDGDITDKITLESNLNANVPGEYIIYYKVEDTSRNESSATRKVIVKKRPSNNGVAVLNYHFFYGDDEYCGEGICLSTRKFEEQLKYLKDNGYKTLSMDEFVKWIYGEIEIPEKSVLLTVDDGALGTGFHNGNKLIPLLEKYQSHATLFLITSWWDINNYKSDYLDVESHTNNMHIEGLCGASRGAKLLCSTRDEVIEDLKKSIEVTKSTKAFCYPFYAYNSNTIEIVKELGFKVAFAAGSVKATRNSNKYAIPRYPIYNNITLETFVKYIS